ncbi:ABC transporter ATP-binding protein [Brachybacterium phenoliresistens]|uniref:ABC transporter ATP-binding protein n=1 Tax=Brachybacterium phenoliresistens TaxID=396014 RepID=UPI0031D25FD4
MSTDTQNSQAPAAMAPLSVATRPGAAAAGPDAVAGPAAPLLRAESVTLSYDGVPAVHEVSTHLHPGRITVLMGPNGSGKSTLLRALAGLHPTQSGHLALGDRPLAAHRPRELAQRLALLAQQRPVPSGFTVRDVVEFGRHPHRSRLTGHDPAGREVVESALEATTLTDLADRTVETLSGGQLQRVWLASCLAQDPEVMLLDEPTNHLDLRHQVELLRLVRRLARERGLAVGLVLHDLQHAAALADEVILLEEGRVVAAGPPAAVMTSARLTRTYQVPVQAVTDPRSGTVRIETLTLLDEVEDLPALSL